MTISTNTTDDLQLVFQNLKSKARITSRTSVKERIDKLKKLEAYLRNPANITSLETALYADFKKFLVGKEYDYTTYTEKSVQDMEKFLAKESYFDEVKEQLELIKSKVNHSKENDLDTHKKEIKKILSEEIVSRYYFQEGMIEASLQGDPVIELA